MTLVNRYFVENTQVLNNNNDYNEIKNGPGSGVGLGLGVEVGDGPGVGLDVGKIMKTNMDNDDLLSWSESSEESTNIADN